MLFSISTKTIAKVVIEIDEAKRLEAFEKHKKSKIDLDKKREAGLSKHLKEKEKLERDRKQALALHLKNQKKFDGRHSDVSPAYYKDVERRKKSLVAYEKIETDFARTKNRKFAKLMSERKFTEEHEFGIDTNPERIPFPKRVFYAKGKSGSGSGSGGGGGPSFGGSSSFPEPPDFPPPPDFNAPPPPPPPDFFEPDFPPPPVPNFPVPPGFEGNGPPLPFDEPAPFPFDDNMQF